MLNSLGDRSSKDADVQLVSAATGQLFNPRTIIAGMEEARDISLARLRQMAESFDRELIKAVVDIDYTAWERLSLLDQMANIGSEVGRAMNARRAHRDDRFWPAVQRALDLFEATVSVEKDRQPHRLKEVGRAKEEFLRIATAVPFDEDEAAGLEAYFMQLGVACRLRALARNLP